MERQLSFEELDKANANSSDYNIGREKLSFISDCPTCHAYAKEWYKSWAKFRKAYAQAAQTKSHILGVFHDG